MGDAAARAILLAAGRGRRLGTLGDALPKCLLSFGGASLLERHVRTLHALGVTELSVVVGYRARAVASELSRVALQRVEPLLNPEYERGSVLSLARSGPALRAGGDVLLMDADVLCSPAVLAPLVEAPGTALLLDRCCELLDPEPVKVAVRAGRVVDFGKQLDPEVPRDHVGESVGFFRLAERAASRLADEVERRVRSGLEDEPYELALRDVLLEEAEHCRVHDVSGLPWIEIDFPEDVERARHEILPRLPARDPLAVPPRLRRTHP